MYLAYQEGNKNECEYLSKALTTFNESINPVACLEQKDDGVQSLKREEGKEDFFLETKSLDQVLVISVDDKLIKKPGRGRPRKNKSASGMSNAGAYDDFLWDKKIQGQISSMLRYALTPGQDGEVHKAQLTPQFCKIGIKLKQSGACEGLQMMGATLSELCMMLEGMLYLYVYLDSSQPYEASFFYSLQWEALWMLKNFLESLMLLAKKQRIYILPGRILG